MLHSRRDGDHEKGQMLVLFALALIVILAFGAIVVDLGLLRNNRQILVNTLDSAALAGGSLLPVDGSVAGHAAAETNLINTTIQANYPGLPPSAYAITYKCLVGVDPNTNLPLVARDVPAACDPRPSMGLGATLPPASAFTGAGPTRISSCDPAAHDKCNVVVITGSATTQFSLGRVVGVNSGSTGTVVSAACNGPCGASPVVPVDLVIVLDRTLSMSASSIASLQTASKAVLSVYDPAKQRVGLAMVGPSTVNAAGAPQTSSSCSPAAYGYGDNNNWTPYATVKTAITTSSTSISVTTATGVPFPATTPFTIDVDSEHMTVTSVTPISGGFTWAVTRPSGATPTSTAKAAHSVGAPVYGLFLNAGGVPAGWVPGPTTVGMWVPVGLSGTDTATPPPNPTGTAGTYEVGGTPSSSSDIVKAINCISSYSDGTDLATPVMMAQWYLDHYGRKGVTQGIILETDGHPQYGFGGGVQDQANTSLAYTCKAAANVAAAAKADTTNTAIDPTIAQGIQIFTVGYGVTSGTYCPTFTSNLADSTGTYNTYEGTDGTGFNWSHVQATTLLRTMATDSSHFYDNPTSAQLAAVFTDAATKLAHSGAHLVQLNPAPVVTGASGAASSVTISGKYFTGAFSVTFGGTPAISYTVGGDTSITAKAPAGTKGSTVDVIVTTAGGTSTVTPADQYTYP